MSSEIMFYRASPVVVNSVVNNNLLISVTSTLNNPSIGITKLDLPARLFLKQLPIITKEEFEESRELAYNFIKRRTEK
jgi:hypothetical protein